MDAKKYKVQLKNKDGKTYTLGGVCISPIIAGSDFTGKTTIPAKITIKLRLFKRAKIRLVDFWLRIKKRNEYELQLIEINALFGVNCRHSYLKRY